MNRLLPSQPPPLGYEKFNMSGMILVVLCVGLYFLPLFCGIGMKKRNAAAIGVLNLFLGWTIVGWVVALVWAFTVDATPPELPESWTCGKCAAELRSTDKFCPSCANEIEW